MKLINREILEKNIQEIVDYDFSNNKVFGCAYSVYQAGERVYQNCFGHTSIDKNKPITENTLFRLASMTKPVTAVATLILIERGLLSLDDKVSDFIPEYKGVHVTEIVNGQLKDLGVTPTPVTVFHLLTHSSGIGSNGIKAERFITKADKQTALDTARFYARIGLDFVPGRNQLYSGTGAFSVLSYVIEKVSGKSLQDFINEEIFKPCKMNDTTFIPNQEQWSNLVDLHARIDGKDAIAKTEKGCLFLDYPCTHILGGAGLASSLSDYVKFANMLLNFGKVENKTIVSKEIFTKLCAPHVEIDEYTRWGFGVRVITSEKHPTLSKGAFGWSGAFGSHFWVDVENKVVAVFMKNSTIDGGAGNESARNFEFAVRNALNNLS